MLAFDDLWWLLIYWLYLQSDWQGEVYKEALEGLDNMESPLGRILYPIFRLLEHLKSIVKHVKTAFRAVKAVFKGTTIFWLQIDFASRWLY